MLKTIDLDINGQKRKIDVDKLQVCLSKLDHAGLLKQEVIEKQIEKIFDLLPGTAEVGQYQELIQLLILFVRDCFQIVE